MIPPSAIFRFIRACEADENINLISFALLQNDGVSARFCKKPYREDAMQLLFSMTKSFTSLAVGIAIDRGLLSLDDRIASFFPEELPEQPHPNLLKMKVRHLLTMTTGIHDNTYPDLFPRPDWIKAFLGQEFPHEPGTYYRYSTHASHMLSALIQKVTNMSLENFLNESLFFPMGITEAQWEQSPEGLTAGGMGLSLCQSSLVKIAFMLMNRGVYNGKRLISEEYIVLATSPQVTKQDDINDADQYYSGSQYGFQFHVSPNGMYRADGAFGQFCIIHPGNGFAVIATSQRTSTERFLQMVDNYFINMDETERSVSQADLDAYLSELAFPVPEHGDRIGPVPQAVYSLEENELDIGKIRFSEDQIELFFTNGTRDVIDIVVNEYVYGRSRFIKDLQVHLQEHCVFTSQSPDGILTLTVYYIETPYVGTYTFRFFGEEVLFTFSVNVSLTQKGFEVEGTRITESDLP